MYWKEVIPPSILDQIEKWEEKANQGDINAVMAQLNLLCGVPAKVLKSVDVRDLNEMMKFISRKIYNPKREGEEASEEEKKSETGEDKLQS